MKISINGSAQEVEVLDPATPLLWVIRDELGLVGTKFGCGISQCGACTVLLDGEAVKSCSYPVSALGERNVTTIEGLIHEDGSLSPLQKAWIKEDVAQCGYCQSGQVMAAEALLRRNPNPTDQEIDEAMESNLCRCGTYTRIKKAIRVAVNQQTAGE